MDSEFLDGTKKIAGVDIPMIAGDSLKEQFENLTQALKETVPLTRDRPYTSQQPRRSQQLVEGLTMRDIRDCAIKGFLLSNGNEQSGLYQKAKDGTCCSDDIYELELGDIDPIAAMQNMQCEIEKMMGIYPNLLDSGKEG